jgi:YD repeat-containing protein
VRVRPAREVPERIVCAFTQGTCRRSPRSNAAGQTLLTVVVVKQPISTKDQGRFMIQSARKVVAFAWLVVVFSYVAKAQNGTYSCSLYNQLAARSSNNCMFYWSFDDLPDPNSPPTQVCCNPFGIPWGESCIAPRPSCGVPPGAAPETCLSCNQGKTVQASAPVDLATGNTYITQSDLSVPGLGGGLSLSRTWNSLLPARQNSYPFLFGTGWRSNYEERLIFVSGDGYVKYLRADGSVWSFAPISLGTTSIYKPAAPADDTTTTITNGTPSWTLTTKSGEKRLFDSTTGALVSIIDRNGNALLLSYDTANRLATVTDAASRHLYFHYLNGLSTLVSSVTSDVGLSTAYTYDGLGRLSQFTKPDNTSVSFEYNAQSLITAVKDYENKILESHTYDAVGRGLTSSRAGGVGSVTVSYPQ